MQWIPECGVQDTELMEPITQLDRIPKDRWDLQCIVCKQRVGAKVQCTKCYSAFHPLCGRMAGFVMEMNEGPGGPDAPLVQLCLCPKHGKPRPHLAGLRKAVPLDGAGDGNGDSDEDTLIHGFPYAMQPSLPLPLPTEGASRLQPWSALQRCKHGTGIGSTTNRGWWIPELPPPETAEALMSTQPRQSAIPSAPSIGTATSKPVSASVSVGPVTRTTVCLCHVKHYLLEQHIHTRLSSY